MSSSTLASPDPSSVYKILVVGENLTGKQSLV